MTESENKDIPEAEENEDEYEAETEDESQSLYCKPYSAVYGQLCIIRKLLALVESGQVTLLPTNHDSGVLPSSFVGYEDDDFYYVALDISHKAVKRFCSAQDECFAISSRALAKALAEEGLIESDDGKNTRTMSFGGVNKRVMLLRKREARKIFEDGV